MARRALNPLHLDLVRYPLRSQLPAFLRQFLPGLGIDVVLDVGAHQGEFALEVRDEGFRGRIVSFEPVQDSFAVLERNAARDSDWFVHRLALGDVDETRAISTPPNPQLASFLRPTERGRSLFPLVDGGAGSEDVPVRRLDAIADDLFDDAASPSVYLKVDTQGWEIQVLDGGERTLRRVKALQVELSIMPIYEGATPYLEMLEELRERGFVPSGFFPVASSPRFEAVEVDCVLVRAQR